MNLPMWQRRITQISGRLCLLSVLAVAAHAQRMTGDFTLRARPYEHDMRTAAARYGLDPLLLQVVAYLETRFTPSAISPRGARGLMQFMPATAARYRLRNPHHPPAAIAAAAQYLHDLSLRFQHRADLVLAAYNAGETTVEAYQSGRTIQQGTRVINRQGKITGGIPPYRETRNYVARGLKLLAQLRSNSLPVPTSDASAKKDSDPAMSAHVGIVHRSIRASRNNEASAVILKAKSSRRSVFFGNKREND